MLHACMNVLFIKASPITAAIDSFCDDDVATVAYGIWNVLRFTAFSILAATPVAVRASRRHRVADSLVHRVRNEAGDRLTVPSQGVTLKRVPIPRASTCS